MSVARAWCLGLLPVFKGPSAIQLENIVVVTFEVRSSKAGQRFQALEILLKEIFTACNAVHLLCVLIGQEHKDLPVELWKSHMEYLVVVWFINLVEFIYLSEVVLSLLLVLAHLVVKELLNQWRALELVGLLLDITSTLPDSEIVCLLIQLFHSEFLVGRELVHLLVVLSADHGLTVPHFQLLFG
jgi:hypothetical protein